MKEKIKSIGIDLLFATSGAIIAAMVFLFTTFTTFDYVNAKHESVMDVLHEIRESVKKIEERVFNLTKQKGSF